MSRNPSARVAALAVPALFVVVLVANILLPGDPHEDLLATKGAEFSLISPAGAASSASLTARGSSTETSATPIALPRASNVTSGPETAAAGEDVADQATSTVAQDTTTTEAPKNPSTAAAPAEEKPMASDGPGHSRDDPTEVNGYNVHNFVDHVNEVLGSQMLAAGQERYGGYQRVGPYELQGRSTITAVQPVTEQAITEVIQKNPDVTGGELERKIAKRITELNDWKQLDSHTKENMMVLSGVDIASMDKEQRENTVNHLQHSPLPFGPLDEVLTPDTTISLGFTHTLDKDWTQVAHLGDGIFQIFMVSNNNNGSHTGHNLGSFKVQLTATTSLDEARQIGNEMIQNKNNNNKLYLDEAARRLLYGQTPWLDFSYLTPEERLTTYAGKSLGQGGPPPGAPTPTAPTPTDGTAPTTVVDTSSTTTGPDETTSTMVDESPTTTVDTAPDQTTSTTVEGTSPEQTTSTTSGETTSTDADPAR